MNFQINKLTHSLGKRESIDEVPIDKLEEPVVGSDAEKIRKSLRHPIYVHSKIHQKSLKRRHFYQLFPTSLDSSVG